MLDASNIRFPWRSVEIFGRDVKSRYSFCTKFKNKLLKSRYRHENETRGNSDNTSGTRCSTLSQARPVLVNLFKTVFIEITLDDGAVKRTANGRLFFYFFTIDVCTSMHMRC